MINVEKVADNLFNKIRSRFDGLAIKNANLENTKNPKQARYFIFNFVGSDNVEYGEITMHLGDDKNLLVYYDLTLDDKMSNDIKDEWYAFLRSLRNFARRNRSSYDVRDITKDGLELRDLKHVKKDQDVYNADEVVNENLNELFEPTTNYYTLSDGKTIQATYTPMPNQNAVPGTVKISYVDPALKPQGGSFDSTGVPERWDSAPDGVKQEIIKFVQSNPQQPQPVAEAKLSGTSRSSYENFGPTKIIVRHSKKVDEEILGARSRNIAAIYVENHLGERFRLPEGTSVSEARAYARHVKNGGKIDDEFGSHISEIINEMHSLRTFVRNMRGRQFEDAETQTMVETAIDYYGKLHKDLHSIRGQRGYQKYKESWVPQNIIADDVNLEELRARFERRIFDERLSAALPIVARAYKQRRNWAEDEFKEWASGVLGEYDENLEEESEAYRHHQKIRTKSGLPDPDYYQALKKLYNKNLNNEISDQELEVERQKLKQRYDVKENFVVDVEENEIQSTEWKVKFPSSFNDDDYYVYDPETKHIIKVVGRKSIGWHNTPAEAEKRGLKVARGMSAKHLGLMVKANPGLGGVAEESSKQNIRSRLDKALEETSQGSDKNLDENLRKWFKEKWVRFGPDGKIRGDCARGSESEGKPKCLPQSKAHSLGKKARASAAAKKRREDPNPERHGAAKNVATKTNEQELDEKWSDKYKRSIDCANPKGFSQRAHCQGKNKNEEVELEERKKKSKRRAYYAYWYPGFGYYAGGGESSGDGGGDGGSESIKETTCPACGGEIVEHSMLNEKRDACYYKVKSRYKVWPSAYASGALVKCRKKGAKNWGTKKESIQEASLGIAISWPEMVDKLSKTLKVMGWRGMRQDDDTFTFLMPGRMEDEWYTILIENQGDGWFTYALGTVEEGDPYIGLQETLPLTEASLSMLMGEIREGFDLVESLGPEQRRVGQLPQDAAIKTGRVIGNPPQKQRGLTGKLVGETDPKPYTPGPLLYELFNTTKKISEDSIDSSNEGEFDKLFQDNDINFTYLNGEYILDSAPEVARAKDIIASNAVNSNKKIKYPKFDIKRDNEITGASTWERSPVRGAK
jgi:hypothetical protein